MSMMFLGETQAAPSPKAKPAFVPVQRYWLRTTGPWPTPIGKRPFNHTLALALLVNGLIKRPKYDEVKHSLTV